MDDGQMTTTVASSDGSREKIEKKEGKGRKGGNEGSFWFDGGEGGMKVAQRIFVGEF